MEGRARFPSDAPSTAIRSPAASEQAALGSLWPGKGCVAMGEWLECLVPRMGWAQGSRWWLGCTTEAPALGWNKD